METNQTADQELWNIAKKRASFKGSLFSYFVINAFFVIIWSLGDRSSFWPVWCMLGWGVGLCFQYFKAYHKSKIFSVDKEYEKLKNK